MHLLQDNPIIKILQFWVIGILCAYFFPEANAFRVGMVSGLAALALLARQLKFVSSDFKRLFATWSIATLFMLLSAFNYLWQPKTEVPQGIEKQVLVLQLQEPLVEKTRSLQGCFQIIHAEEDSLVGLKTNIYFPKETPDSSFQVGACFTTHAQLKRIKTNDNPYAFDYADYLANQGIYFSSYLHAEDLQSTTAPPLDFSLHCGLIRQKLLHIYRQRLNPEAYPLVEALSLGYRGDMSKEQKSYFQDAGIVHILAVSGLHVGIVCVILGWLFAPLKRRRKLAWLYAVLMLTGIWAYAALTGFAPSVQRAAFMFSVLTVAHLIHRRSAVFSSIALSALALLVISPELLFDVGFQLSYCAVIAIVFLKPRFDHFFTPRTRVGHWAWDISSVSLAAQLGTLPCSLFYFHQFPSYFLLSNLVAIPAAMIILSLSLLALTLSAVPMISDWLFALLEWAVQGFVGFFAWFGSLPMVAIRNIHVSPVALFFLLLALLSLFLWSWQGKRKAIWLALVLGFFAVAENRLDKYARQSDMHIIAHPNSVWQLSSGSTHYIIYSDSIPPLPHVYQSAIAPLRLDEPTFINLSETDSFHDAHLIIRNDVVQFEDSVWVIGR
ncbi:MAG: ComEC/Rec2 family competence protein [Mangrovibacterium sp.]